MPRRIDESFARPSLPFGCQLRRQSRRVHIFAMPQLEHQQLPQAQRVIALAAQVLVENPIDEPIVEIAALAGAGRTEHVTERIAQRPAEPVPERYRESLLRSIE